MKNTLCVWTYSNVLMISFTKLRIWFQVETVAVAHLHEQFSESICNSEFCGKHGVASLLKLALCLE